jgi:hypothetical protein
MVPAVPASHFCGNGRRCLLAPLALARVDSTTIVGIAGVLGTLAGTGRGAWTTNQVAKRREQREEKAEAKKGRAAARMIRLDVVRSAATLNWMLGNDVWDPEKAYLPTENWRAQQRSSHSHWTMERRGTGSNSRWVAGSNTWLRSRTRLRQAQCHQQRGRTSRRVIEAEKALAPLAGDPDAQALTGVDK